MIRTASLRSRVVGWGVVVVTLILVSLEAFLYFSLRERSLNDLGDLLEARVGLAEELAPQLTPEQLVARLDGSGVRVRNREPTGLEAQSDADDVGIPEETPLPIDGSGRELSRFVELPNGEVVELYISRSGVDETLRRLFIPAALGTAGGIGLAALLLARSARLALRPLDSVVETAQRIQAGGTGERLSPERTDTELGRLAAAFDEMLDALEAALDDARASEQRTRRFLAEAAHQLRTPVAGIQASAETLLSARNRDERERLLNNIGRESARAGRRVAALLRMARLEQGDAPARRPTDLWALCRDEVARTASLAPALQVRFQPAGGVELSGPEAVDPDGVREALANLLDNARRHARSSVDVVLERRGDTVRLSVADDGPGLAAGDAERAFDAFVSLDGRGGSGLGLAIARGIARAHGGDVTYRDSRFELWLPTAGSGRAEDGSGIGARPSRSA